MMDRRLGGTTLALVLLACGIAGPAGAATREFASSFEPSDAQPTWVDTAERASGVTGPERPGIPGNVTDTVVAMRASGENADGGEGKENLVDGSPDSKWLAFDPDGWVELELAEPATIVRYALTSANDHAERDPRDWTLKGSNDGSSWTTLDTPLRRESGRARRDEGVRLRQHGRVRALPARHHPQRRRRRDPARRAAAVQRAAQPAARAGHALDGGQRPARRLQRQAGRRLHGPAGAALRRPTRGRGPRVLLQQGLRRRRAGPAEDEPVLRHLSRLPARRPRVPEHVRGGRPALHGRHLPERPRRPRSARREAQPSRPGCLQDAVHEPVELQALAHRRGRGRQDRRPHPRRVRQPARHP